MKRIRNRARWVASAVLAVGGLVAFAACTEFKNQLLEPQNPGLIDPSAVSTPAAAMALEIGALGRLRFVVDCGGNNECLWEEAGDLTDEFHNSDFQTVRQDIDQRLIDPDNPEIPWTSVTQNRGFIRDAIGKVIQFLPDSTADIAELYLGLGFLETSLAENYCNGIPLGHTIDGVVTYGAPLTDAQVLDSALTHLDSALTIDNGASDNAKFIRQAILVAKARVLVDQGKFTEAAALVPSSAVPSDFQYLFSTSPAKSSDDLGIWVINNSTARMTVSDSFEVVNGTPSVTANALPFASANDPRVPVKSGQAVTPHVGAEDGSTPMFVQLLFGRDDPIPMVSGIDARLIEAEAKLNAHDIAGMMTILNALRASPPAIGALQPQAMSALPTPASQDAATTLFFREKAFWTFARGQRLNDMRRLMRQYKRTEAQVYPTGAYFKGGTYGHSLQLPVPNGEKPNSLFTGCIDTNP
jgi:starch-binding outer membrane protein, SusD/RagB family